MKHKFQSFKLLALHLFLKISQFWHSILYEFARRFLYEILHHKLQLLLGVFFGDSWNGCVHFGPCPHLTASSLENKYPNKNQCNGAEQITSNCPKDHGLAHHQRWRSFYLPPLISFLKTIYPSHKSRNWEVTNVDNVFHHNYKTLWPKATIITWFGPIEVFRGTNIIMQNILHIQHECGDILHNIVNPT